MNLIGPKHQNIALEPFHTAVRIRIIAQSYAKSWAPDGDELQDEVNALKRDVSREAVQNAPVRRASMRHRWWLWGMEAVTQ